MTEQEKNVRFYSFTHVYTHTTFTRTLTYVCIRNTQHTYYTSIYFIVTPTVSERIVKHSNEVHSLRTSFAEGTTYSFASGKKEKGNMA